MNHATDQNDIPFGRPSLGAEEEEAALRVLRSGWLTTGKECAAFEHEFAEMVGVPHAIAVSSATAGLHLALEACGVTRGDAVVTTPLTFAATAEVICALGAHPVFADIEPHTGNIDPEKAAAAMQQHSARAVIPVHLGGLRCSMEKLQAAAETCAARIVEDAAHSFPANIDGQYSGTSGDAGVYSFYANKTITTGEGGMIVTHNDDYARRIKIMRMHGIDRDVWQRFTETRASWRYDVVEPGYKYNLPDLLAAIGRIQLKKAHQLHAARQSIAEHYRQGLKDAAFLELPPAAAEHSYHLFQIRLHTDRLRISRDEFIHQLQKSGISASVHYIPLHIMSCYAQRMGLHPQDYPAALEWYERCISLPIYPDLEYSQVERIIDTVLKIGRSASGTDNN